MILENIRFYLISLPKFSTNFTPIFLSKWHFVLIVTFQYAVFELNNSSQPLSLLFHCLFFIHTRTYMYTEFVWFQARTRNFPSFSGQYFGNKNFFPMRWCLYAKKAWVFLKLGRLRVNTSIPFTKSLCRHRIFDL